MNIKNKNMEYFVSVNLIPQKLLNHYIYFIVVNKSSVAKFSFKMEIYKWCLANKIYYKTYNKSNKCGFLFRNKDDFMALKMKWF